jgi:hypothetical protein
MGKKIAAKPILGSFYIIKDKIYYNYEGLDHVRLWPLVVDRVFGRLDYENRKELRNAVHGAERGRVSWQGNIDSEGNPTGKGNYILYGTPGCEKYAGKIKNLFKLTDLEKLKVDWKTDEHYKTISSDVNILEDMLKLIGNKINLKDTMVSTFLSKVLKKIKLV